MTAPYKRLPKPLDDADSLQHRLTGYYGDKPSGYCKTEGRHPSAEEMDQIHRNWVNGHIINQLNRLNKKLVNVFPIHPLVK
jgi:hypothetical protein